MAGHCLAFLTRFAYFSNLRKYLSFFKQLAANPALLYENAYVGLGVLLGILGTLTGIAILLVREPSESRDWLYFFLLVTILPTLLLGGAAKSARARHLFLLAAPVFMFAAFLGGVVTFAQEIVPSLVKIEKLSGFSPGFLMALALTASLSAAALNFWLIRRSSLWLGKLGDMAPGKPEWLLFLAIFYALFLMSDTDKPLFFLQQKYLVIYPLFALLPWYLGRIFRGQIPEGAPKKWDKIDLLWLLGFLSLARIPLQEANIYTTHHWSFYVGPIESVRHGGTLLYDVASQYGFLSILVPALLPFSPADSMFVVLVVLLFVQAILIYALLRNFSWFRSDRLLPGILTLACAYFLGGGRTTFLGTFEMPSTSAYRFFWAYALVFVLASRSLQMNRLRQNLLVSALFLVGALWSAESLFYCVGVLGASWGAELLLKMRGDKSNTPRAIVDRILWPGLGLAVGVTVVELTLRYGVGVVPDWRAFVEYPLAYQGGFGALPIHFIGAVNAMGMILVATAFLLAYGVFIRRTIPSGGAFGAWGFLLGSYTYFISRSHPSNIANLYALWFPVVCLVFDETRIDSENRIRMRPLFCFLTALLLLLTFARWPLFLGRVAKMVSQKAFSSMEDVLAMGEEKKARVDEILQYQRSGVPLLDLTANLPSLSLPAYHYTPFYPVYPIVEFTVLDQKRQGDYIGRFLERHRPEKIQLVRRVPTPEPPSDLEQVMNTMMERYYSKEDAKSLKDLSIETYRLRR